MKTEIKTKHKTCKFTPNHSKFLQGSAWVYQANETFPPITALSNLSAKTNPQFFFFFLQVTSWLWCALLRKHFEFLWQREIRVGEERRDGKIRTERERGMRERHAGWKNRKQNKWNQQGAKVTRKWEQLTYQETALGRIVWKPESETEKNRARAWFCIVDIFWWKSESCGTKQKINMLSC